MSEQQHKQTGTESQTVTAGDGLSQYLKLRAEYVEQLREHDLLEVRGGLRADVVDALFGSGDTMIPVRGSPMAEYCEKHPEDPLCQRIDSSGLAEQFLDIRSEFIGKVNEHDLGEVQRFVAELSGAAGDGSPIPVPFDTGNARAGSIGLGNVGNAGLIGPDQDLDDVPPWLRPYVNPRLFSDVTSIPPPFRQANGTGIAANLLF